MNAEDQFAYQRGRDQKADAKSDVEWYGKQASAVDQMQGPQREAAWQSIISRHGAGWPDAGRNGPDDRAEADDGAGRAVR